MASTAVTAMPHSITHMPLPAIPRVRPPRMLPGTPSPNTNPRPPGPIPTNSVWVQGKWRNPSSSASKQQQKVVSAQVKKALRHHKHGMQIFAYYHIRTHQVVYSLTRIMQSSQILPQLLFHGKQTRPRALRRDHWRPYFSVHFPQTPAGARAGLTAYQRLREFAERRQLSPDIETLRTTQQDIEKFLSKKGDPVDVWTLMSDKLLKPPALGSILPLRERAAKLMDQKATAVADASFVLKMAVEQIKNLTTKDLSTSEKERKKGLGHRGKRRMNAIMRQEKEKQNEILERQDLVDKLDVGQGRIGLDKKVAEQLSIEYDGIVEGITNRVVHMKDLEVAPESNQAYFDRLREIEKAPKHEREALKEQSAEVQVLWADIRDGTYAADWPKGVFHADANPIVTSHKGLLQVREFERVDEDGTVVEEQKERVSVVSGSSPHIMGREWVETGKLFQKELEEDEKKRKDKRWEEAEMEVTRERQARLRQLRRDARDKGVTESPKSVATHKEMVALEQEFPDLAAQEDRRECWASMRAEENNLNQRLQDQQAYHTDLSSNQDEQVKELMARQGIDVSEATVLYKQMVEDAAGGIRRGREAVERYKMSIGGIKEISEEEFARSDYDVRRGEYRSVLEERKWQAKEERAQPKGVWGRIKSVFGR